MKAEGWQTEQMNEKVLMFLIPHFFFRPLNCDFLLLLDSDEK
jgi:hypothetical protein